MKTPRWLRRPDVWLAGALFFLTLGLYTTTLAPSVVTIFDDSLEFQLVTYQLGIAHPTGYPLYTLLGHLFTWLPFGNVAYRVNWLSAVFGALTVALTYLLAVNWSQPNRQSGRLGPPNGAVRAGAAAGALLLAVGPVFWAQATIAEVYTLNAFFVAALLLLATQLPPCARRGEVFGLALLAGLSLTHHRTMLLLLPALGLYLLLFCDRSVLLRPKTILVGAACGLLPLLLYLYLPLRGQVGSLDGTYEQSWAGFWRQVTASGYGAFIFDNPFGHQRDGWFYWNMLADQFYTTVPGIIGLAFLFRFGQRRWLLLSGVAFVTYLLFNLFYNVADIEVFFIPNFLIWAIWSGIGIAFLMRTATRLNALRWRFTFTGLLALILLVMIGRQLQANIGRIQANHTWQVHDYGVDMLRQPLEEQATIVGLLGEMTLLRYFQQTEGLRPDIQTIAADEEAERLATVTKLLQTNRPVYLTRPLPGAAKRWSLSAVGPLITVRPRPQTAPPEIPVQLEQAVMPEISLLGYDVNRAPHTGSGPAPVRLTLFWQAQQPLTAELKVSARLVDQAGVVQAAVDAAPVHFAYPTTAWRPGEIIADVYDLPLPADSSPGLYTPLIIWYDPAQNAAETGRVELAPIVLD